MNNEFTFGTGYLPSVIDGTEYEFEKCKSLKIPETYNFLEEMPPVLNQGSTNMCVTYSIAAHLDWNINMDMFTPCKDNSIDKRGIYSAKSVSGDNGMTFKEAFNYIKYNGVKTDIGNVKIDYYAKINDLESLKQSIVVNGPCVGGMYCWNNYNEFWKKNTNDKSMGGHAISIVGYNKDGLIIRNSWGTRWGNSGYYLLNYKDFNKLLEIWTIVD